MMLMGRGGRPGPLDPGAHGRPTPEPVVETSVEKPLPPGFLCELMALEAAYLAHDDPIKQSGFFGGAARWRAEREPILDAIESDGDVLDVGCANGFLLECLVAWGGERGLALTPCGLDLGPRLIACAQERLPAFAANFYIGNAWSWQPPRRFRYVYGLHDCVPADFLGEFVERLLGRVVADGGRLIVGAYGSTSKGLPALDVRGFLESAGFEPLGARVVGDLPVASFSWVDK